MGDACICPACTPSPLQPVCVPAHRFFYILKEYRTYSVRCRHQVMVDPGWITDPTTVFTTQSRHYHHGLVTRTCTLAASQLICQSNEKPQSRKGLPLIWPCGHVDRQTRVPGEAGTLCDTTCTSRPQAFLPRNPCQNN